MCGHMGFRGEKSLFVFRFNCEPPRDVAPPRLFGDWRTFICFFFCFFERRQFADTPSVFFESSALEKTKSTLIPEGGSEGEATSQSGWRPRAAELHLLCQQCEHVVAPPLPPPPPPPPRWRFVHRHAEQQRDSFLSCKVYRRRDI